jgi:hypothetical protein
VSQQTPPPAGAGGQQPSEEEIRAYLGQLRQAPAEQVLAEVLSGLLNAAQVKVGRRDGRLLIDVSASLIDQVREHLSEDLTSQVDEVVGQLRMAQVEGERELESARAQGHEEHNDLGQERSEPGAAPAEEPEQPPASPPPSSPQPGQGGSRLWTPGG